MNKKFSVRVSYVLVVSMLVTMFVFTSIVTAASDGPVGFAAGVTGGAGGQEVTVTSSSDLSKYAGSTGKYVIRVKGTINNSAGIAVKSDKTIIGEGKDAKITGCGLIVKKASNVIIRNLTIVHNAKVSDNDAIRLDGADKVWVDHCTLDSGFEVTEANESHKDDTDGACDIKNASTNVTVSYCIFRNNWKNMLISSSDSATADKAITVTIHHNWFDKCASRMPSIRFGTAHIYNNYYSNNLITGINSRMGAKTRIENNYFENFADPIGSWDSDTVGTWDVSNNKFVNCTGSQPTTSTGSYKPSYSYSLDAVDSVPSIVKASAGAGNMGVIPTSEPPKTTTPPTTPPTTNPTSEYGDLNGDDKANSTDYALMRRYLLDLVDLSNDQLAVADLNLDGKVNSTDYAILRRFILGYIEELPYTGTPSTVTPPTVTPPTVTPPTVQPGQRFIDTYKPADSDKAKLWNTYITKEVGPLTVGTGGNGGSKTITNTILVLAGTTYDGKGEKITAQGMGNGSQDEGQRPFFLLEPGANLKNVTFTAPGVEGVHMMGNNVLENVVWEDVGEDAASTRSYFPGGNITINGGSAKSAADKVFQFNVECTVKISNFTATDVGKLVRQNGGTTFPLTIYLDNVTVNNFKDAIVRSDSSSCKVYYNNLKSNMPESDWWNGSLKATAYSGSGSGSSSGGSSSTTAPTKTPTTAPTKTPTQTPPPSSGSSKTITSTIIVKAGQTYDGNGERIIAKGLGDGSQNEGQKPIFKLEKGAKLKNVRIAAPGCDGVHVYGDNVVENVIWEDIGEDALTVKGEGTITIIGGSAKDGDDKCFQINSACTFNVNGFTATNVGKLIRQNGGTTFKCTINLENVTVNKAKECVARTDSKTTQLYYKNCTFTNVPELWVFPSASQVHQQ